jgi:hypothetical protein
MATYTFSFPASAAGLAVTIRDAGGSTVGTDTAGAASDTQGAVVVTANLPVGSYTAEAVDAGIHYTSRAPGILDVPASLGDLSGRVADAVDPGSVTFAADLIDALVAAGLMAAT